MAKAEVKEVVVKTRTVVLELTDEEAAFVCAILGSGVSGSAEERVHGTAVWDALRKAGFGFPENDFNVKIRSKMKGMVELNG